MIIIRFLFVILTLPAVAWVDVPAWGWRRFYNDTKYFIKYGDVDLFAILQKDYENGKD
jgi:hypothetical protein